MSFVSSVSLWPVKYERGTRVGMPSGTIAWMFRYTIGNLRSVMESSAQYMRARDGVHLRAVWICSAVLAICVVMMGRDRGREA